MDYSVKYQQGDVLLLKVTDKEFQKHIKATSNNKSTVFKGGTAVFSVIAKGEATGHKHAINMNEMLSEVGVTLYKPQWNQTEVDAPIAIDIAGGSVMIDHEEHNTIEVPEGKYICRIVREFDHITGRTSYVAD